MHNFSSSSLAEEKVLLQRYVNVLERTGVQDKKDIEDLRRENQDLENRYKELKAKHEQEIEERISNYDS